eukprot:165526_1
MVATIVLLYIHTCIVFGILNPNNANLLQFERIFDNAFSNYIFGHKNCYYYEISKDIINEQCHESSSNTNIDNINNNQAHQSDGSTPGDQINWYMPYNTDAIFESNTFKRRILDTNSDCYIGTLHLCPSTLSYEAKAYAFKKFKIPLQTCFSINIVNSKFNDMGVGIQLFQIKDCTTHLYQQTELSQPFILCADDTITTANNTYFCDKNNECVTNFESPNICNENPYTANPTYKPTTTTTVFTNPNQPTNKPTNNPTPKPIKYPTLKPTKYPTPKPTKYPIFKPTAFHPTVETSTQPTAKPTSTIDMMNIDDNVPRDPLTMNHDNIINNLIDITTTMISSEASKLMHTDINEFDLIKKDGVLNVENKTMKIPRSTKWVIGIVMLTGICVILNIGLIIGWKYYMCESYVDNNRQNNNMNRESFWFQNDYRNKDYDCSDNNELENNNSDIASKDLEYKQEEQFEEQKISESVFNQVYANLNLLNDDFYTDAGTSDAECHDHVLDID